MMTHEAILILNQLVPDLYFDRGHVSQFDCESCILSSIHNNLYQSISLPN